MRLLVDSHTFLWMLIAPEALGRQAHVLLEDSQNDLFLSAAALWELVVKESLGKLSAPKKIIGLFQHSQERGLVSYLRIEPAHIAQLAKLPFHHRDPFDRMMIAQAVVEDLKIVSKDKEFRQYKIGCVW